MNKATNLISKAFDDKGLKCSVSEMGAISFVQAGFSGNNTSTTIRFLSQDNDNDVKVLTGNIAKFPSNKLEKGYQMANHFNEKYKYTKFVLDSDGNVSAQYDLPLCTSDDDVGKVCIELAIRFSSIVDELYPEIMKAIWS